MEIESPLMYIWNFPGMSYCIHNTFFLGSYQKRKKIESIRTLFDNFITISKKYLHKTELK